MSITCIFFVSLTFDKLIAFQLFVELHSLSTQEHYMSAKEMRKLLCEFINNILTDLDAGEQRTLRWGGEGGVRGLSEETGMIILNFCIALYKANIKATCSRTIR